MTAAPTNLPGAPLPPARRRARNRLPLMLAGLGVLGLIGYMVFSNANNNLVYYVLPSEYRQDRAKFDGKTLRMGGLAKDVVYNRDTLALKFNMTDGQVAYPVQYQGAVPDMFRNDAVVVMEGQMQSGVFHGKSLLVKHSEEYKAADTSAQGAKGAGQYTQDDLKKILNDQGQGQSN